MNIKKKFLISALLSIGLVNIASAGLAEKINGIINQSSQKGVQYSIIVVKADTGEVVYSRDANKALIPASNMKIITSAAAVKYLGPDYKFKTEVGLCGTSHRDGDTLVVKGSGDPLLGDEATDAKYKREPGWIFKDIAASLKQNGKTTIKDIIVDASIFDNERVHPHWPKEQLNQWYACEVSGLNYNDNCIAMTVTNTDGNAIISIKPQTGFVKITNEVVPITKDKKAKSAVGAYRNLTPNSLTIKGKCQKQEGPFDVAIEKPAEFFGFLLRENLAGAGINVDGQILEQPAPGNCEYKKIAEYSTPITDCLARCNKNSLGLAAETLLKTIAAKADGKNGSWAKGRELISGYMLELGINKDEFYIDDGSGLSRENKLSANAITKVLLDVYRGKNWELYKNSLMIGGVEGTISKPFKEEKYKGKVFGKTGNLDGVKALSGICKGKDGEYIFSILANKVKAGTRDTMNDIPKAIIDND